MAKQTLLRDMALTLRKRGVNIMISNLDHEIVRELYAEFNVRGIQVGRAINSKGTGRGKVGEVIVT